MYSDIYYYVSEMEQTTLYCIFAFIIFINLLLIVYMVDNYQTEINTNNYIENVENDYINMFNND